MNESWSCWGASLALSVCALSFVFAGNPVMFGFAALAAFTLNLRALLSR